MGPWEMAGLGLLFIAAISVSTVITLNMLLPISQPTLTVPLCQTPPRETIAP